MAEGNQNGEAPAVETGTALMTVEHRQVTLLDGNEVLAARVEGGEIFVPILPLCTALGLTSQSQIRRIRANEVLAESLRDLRIAAAGDDPFISQYDRVDENSNSHPACATMNYHPNTDVGQSRMGRCERLSQSRLPA